VVGRLWPSAADVVETLRKEIAVRDQSVLHHINELVEEEKRLLSQAAPTERLQAIEAELDQCWDLLRQRRAHREFGEDPDQSRVRPKDVVENYEG
jgi:hypothetical protein